MKKILVVFSLVLAAFSFEANAATVDLVNGRGSFSATHAGAFSDTWTFSVPVNPPNNGVNVTVTGAWVRVSRAIVDFTATLDGVSLTAAGTPKFLEILLPSGSSGLHNIVVSGKSAGGYGGSIDISQVPVPAAVWLFGSALLGLMGFSRRKKG